MATKMHRKYLYKVGAVAGPARKSVRAERFVTLTHEFRAQKVVVDGSPVAGPALGKRVFFFLFLYNSYFNKYIDLSAKQENTSGPQAGRGARNQGHNMRRPLSCDLPGRLKVVVPKSCSL
jgi:hypothetical protein